MGETMKHSIKIKTRLADGISASSGGGQTRTHYTFTLGPRNLVRAMETLVEHRKEMCSAYGNIGCGKSWIEIDGIDVTNELDELEYELRWSARPTECARKMINRFIALNG